MISHLRGDYCERVVEEEEIAVKVEETIAEAESDVTDGHGDVHLLKMMERTVSEVNNLEEQTTATNESASTIIGLMEALEVTEPPVNLVVRLPVAQSTTTGATAAAAIKVRSPVRRTDLGVVSTAAAATTTAKVETSNQSKEQQPLSQQKMKKKQQQQMCQSNSTFYVPVNRDDDGD